MQVSSSSDGMLAPSVEEWLAVATHPRAQMNLEYWNDHDLPRFRKRAPGKWVVDAVEWMGSMGKPVAIRADLAGGCPPGIGVAAFRKPAFEVLGRTWWRASLVIPPEGPVEWSMVEAEFDRPPENEYLRTVQSYVQELSKRPRAPSRVPGWMKVELAAVGAWDLRVDAPAFEGLEPGVEPHTPESVGVEPPPGAQWALAPELVHRIWRSVHRSTREGRLWGGLKDLDPEAS